MNNEAKRPKVTIVFGEGTVVGSYTETLCWSSTLGIISSLLDAHASVQCLGVKAAYVASEMSIFIAVEGSCER